jgi:signal transduction histidine kinase
MDPSDWDLVARENRILTARLLRSEEQRARLEEHSEKKTWMLRQLFVEKEEARRELEERHDQLETLLKDLRDSERQLRKASDAKNSFLASVTHELRTPLAGIIGLASILKGARPGAETQEFVSGILHSADSLMA